VPANAPRDNEAINLDTAAISQDTAATRQDTAAISQDTAATRRLTELLIEAARPKRIILFGSPGCSVLGREATRMRTATSTSW